MTTLPDPLDDVLGLGSSWPRPGWIVLDAVRDQRFTGEVALGTVPASRLWAERGRIYYAETDGQAWIGARLVDAGVLTAAELERGLVRSGDLDHLGRLFERAPSVDRHRVMVTLELMVDDTVAWLAAQPVRSISVAPYARHPAGIHRWDAPLAPVGPFAPPVGLSGQATGGAPLPAPDPRDVPLVDPVSPPRSVGLFETVTDLDTDVRIEWAEPIAPAPAPAPAPPVRSPAAGAPAAGGPAAGGPAAGGPAAGGPAAGGSAAGASALPGSPASGAAAPPAAGPDLEPQPVPEPAARADVSVDVSADGSADVSADAPDEPGSLVDQGAGQDTTPVDPGLDALDQLARTEMLDRFEVVWPSGEVDDPFPPPTPAPDPDAPSPDAALVDDVVLAVRRAIAAIEMSFATEAEARDAGEGENESQSRAESEPAVEPDVNSRSSTSPWMHPDPWEHFEVRESVEPAAVAEAAAVDAGLADPSERGPAPIIDPWADPSPRPGPTPGSPARGAPRAATVSDERRSALRRLIDGLRGR